MFARAAGVLAASAMLTFLTACAPNPVDAGAVDAIQDGREIAEAQCGHCHAPGPEGDSPRADAPPFRTILARYRADTLTEELISGIKLGHPDMPLFELNPQGADSLVAYLKSIQEPPVPAGATTPN
ncbi:MAG: cytochrome c [Hyphomonadaceae bacterium]|nr:MAG: cytochrome c family protein [Caulobacteraceae bacterium]MBT9446969.1 cytochrome c [Hyphomonadaceae bacterium]TPW08144.1 MAG: cytochrome c family protein [Alphaproteobacteria bacterium]